MEAIGVSFLSVSRDFHSDLADRQLFHLRHDANSLAILVLASDLLKLLKESRIFQDPGSNRKAQGDAQTPRGRS
jgi:hypothetical protein